VDDRLGSIISKLIVEMLKALDDAPLVLVVSQDPFLHPSIVLLYGTDVEVVRCCR
jgi:hypothetical protein